MLVQPNNLADIDFVSVLMKWLIKTIVAAWFISNALTICNCFFGIGASMVSKTTTVLNQQVTDNTQGSVLLKYLSDNYGDQDEDAESGDVSGLISLTVSTWFIDVIIKFMGILITIILYSRMISIYLHCAVAPLPMATVTNHHMRPLWREDKQAQRASKQEDKRKMLPVSLDQLYEDTEYEMSDGVDLEEDFIKREMLKELHAALDELEGIDRTIMKMFGDGATEKQIAEVVHLSQKGVNKRKKKVFVQLKTRLKDFE